MLWILVLFIWSPVQAFNITLDESRELEAQDLKSCYLKSNPTLSGSIQDIYIGIMVLDIDQIREDSMDFRLHCYLYTSWTNQRMNIIVVNQAYPVTLPTELSDCMWKPDIIFPNSLEIITFESTVVNRGFKYFENRKILLTERFIFRVSCPMHFSLFPLDTQRCSFNIGLMLNPDHKALLHWNENYGDGGVGYVSEMQPLQFRISKPKMEKITGVWLSGNYTELRGVVTFYRRLTSSFLNYYIPSTLVVILSWISFYIDVESAPARVTLGVTALLTISTQMIQARGSLPPVQYITSMDVWLFFCLSLVFGSFVEFSIAYACRQKCKNKIQSKPSSPLSTMDNVVRENKGSKRASISPIDQFKNNTNFTANTPEKLDKISRWLFPLTLLIFCIVYWSYLYCKTENKPM